MTKISELYIYPVKSLAGIKLTSAKLSKFGLLYDRRWLIVDKDGQFITQRQHHEMATIKTAISNKQLTLSHNNSSILVPHPSTKELSVTVWNDTLKALHIDTQVDQWLSDKLNTDCQLVYMPEDSQRQIDLNFAPKKQYVNFADAYPLLVISQASLDELNNRLENPVNINRFRANIIIDDCQAFTEDKWHTIAVNTTEFKAVKKCSRCIMPSINQTTGKQDQVKMLATLNTFRKFDKKIKFGQNLIYKNIDLINGQLISCGDEIIEKK